LAKKYKALALFSGGLDSLLSVLWMEKIGVEVIPIFFRTPFFTEERPLATAEANGIKLTVIDFSAAHLEMLRHPQYGFGKNFNPCIDCHGLMFHTAGDLLSEFNADFLISGEVLSQRPMSQRRDAMNAVGKLSGYKDLLVRPLCQQLLDDTLPIREGWINKDDLLAFNGRSRKPQMELAKELGVVTYPHPAGGCRLTDKNFSVRLRDLILYDQLELDNINLLRFGRHFRLNTTTKLIIGRDEEDNENLTKLNIWDVYLNNEEIPGPIGIIHGNDIDDEIIRLSASILAFYSRKAPEEMEVAYGKTIPLQNTILVQKADADTAAKYMIKE
jgi:tRNA U34 2-thiouridine synthase MnmA/TrmU